MHSDCRILDDADIEDADLLAGKQPALMAVFVERAKSENDPDIDIHNSLYYFQVRECRQAVETY